MKSLTRILVTGGAGFIGSHLVDRLLTKGFEVTALDDFSNGQMKNISNNREIKEFHFVRGDVRDKGLVKRIVKDVDVVFHEAAVVDVALSIKNPLHFNDINVAGTLNLLKACVDSDVKRFVFASSAAVYGDTQLEKKREEMILKPISPYGITKLAAEKYLQVFYESYGLETVSLRYFNVYGPRQAFASSYSGVITAFIGRLLKNLPPIIYSDGRQSRDFVYVDDVVSANLLALETRNAVGEVLNIASGDTITINELANILQHITNTKHLRPIFTERKLGDIRHCSACIERAKDLLNFQPKIKLEDGLQKLFKWYKSEEYAPNNLAIEKLGSKSGNFVWTYYP